MIIELKIPDSIPLDPQVTVEMRFFLQAFVNRRGVGALRYGDKPRAKQRYMSRLRKELASYIREGNAEQLMNIAVYAFLESVAPENKKIHWDVTAESVTRGEFGI